MLSTADHLFTLRSEIDVRHFWGSQRWTGSPSVPSQRHLSRTIISFQTKCFLCQGMLTFRRYSIKAYEAPSFSFHSMRLNWQPWLKRFTLTAHIIDQQMSMYLLVFVWEHHKGKCVCVCIKENTVAEFHCNVRIDVYTYRRYWSCELSCCLQRSTLWHVDIVQIPSWQIDCKMNK